MGVELEATYRPVTVSYTHLDVSKRQILINKKFMVKRMRSFFAVVMLVIAAAVNAQVTTSSPLYNVLTHIFLSLLDLYR